MTLSWFKNIQVYLMKLVLLPLIYVVRLNWTQTLHPIAELSRLNEEKPNAGVLMMQFPRQVTQHPFSWRSSGRFPLSDARAMLLVQTGVPSASQTERHQTHRRRGSVSEKGFIDKGVLSPFRNQDRMDGACELLVSRESFGFLIKAQKRAGNHMTPPRFKVRSRQTCLCPWQFYSRI